MNTHVLALIFLSTLKLSLCQDDEYAYPVEDDPMEDEVETAEDVITAEDRLSAENGGTIEDRLSEEDGGTIEDRLSAENGGTIEDRLSEEDGGTIEDRLSAEDVGTIEDGTTGENKKLNFKTGQYALNTMREIPFSKAKVKYHRSRLCIKVPNDKVHCLNTLEMPGNPATVAKFFKVYMDSTNSKLEQPVKNNKRLLWQKVNG